MNLEPRIYVALVTSNKDEDYTNHRTSFFLASNRLNWCRKAKQIVDNFKYPYFGGCGWWIVIVRSRHWRQNQLVWVTQLCVLGRCAVPGARQTGLRNPCHEPLTGFPTPAQRRSAGLRMCRAAVSGQIGLFSYGSSNTASNEQIIKRDRLRIVPYV